MSSILIEATRILKIIVLYLSSKPETMLLGILIGAVIGGVVAIFVYRNNQALLGRYADELDDVYRQLNEERRKNKQK